MVNNNEIKCSLPGPSRETNTNNDGNSNLNNIWIMSPYQKLMNSNTFF